MQLRNNKLPRLMLVLSSRGINFLYWETMFLSLLHRIVQFGHKIQCLLQDTIWERHQLLKVYVVRQSLSLFYSWYLTHYCISGYLLHHCNRSIFHKIQSLIFVVIDATIYCPFVRWLFSLSFSAVIRIKECFWLKILSVNKCTFRMAQ